MQKSKYAKHWNQSNSRRIFVCSLWTELYGQYMSPQEIRYTEIYKYLYYFIFWVFQMIDERKDVGDPSDHITRLDIDGIQVCMKNLINLM